MENFKKVTSILLVDDDDAFRERLARAFQKRGYVVTTAANAMATKSMLAASSSQPDAAVIDLKMPGESGLELARWLAGQFPTMRLLMLTGYGSIASAVHAVKVGVADYLTKPADADQILRALFAENTEKTHPELAEAVAQAPSLGRVEWEHIQRVLHECGGSISAAARALGIERRSLQRKLQKFPPAT